MRLFSRHTSEAELIREACAGKARSQQMLYDRHHRKMFGVCLRYAPDRATAEDMLQEGFIHAFRYLATFRGEGSFEGWLRRVMAQTAAGYMKRRKPNYLAASIEEAESAPAPFEDHLEAAYLLELVQALPDGCRTVFNLYAIEGYAHKEIAELLGVSVGTSKSQLAHARKLLQKQLKPVPHETA